MKILVGDQILYFSDFFLLFYKIVRKSLDLIITSHSKIMILSCSKK
jgi:hypothetical protein